MNEQLLLLTALVLCLAAFVNHFGSGTPFAFSLAAQVNAPGRNYFSQLYERAQLWFEKEADELKKEFKEGFEKYKGEIKTIVDGIKDASDKKASKDDLDKLKEDLTKKIGEVQDLADELQTKQDRINLNQEKEVKGKSFMQQYEEKFIALQKKMKGNGGLKSLPKRDGEEIEIDLKAVSNITSSYAFPNGGTNIIRGLELEPGVSKDPQAPLFVTDIISTGITDSHTIEWMERILLEGGASQVAEAAAFSQISAKWDKKSATSKKTAAFSKVTEEMLEDVDFVMGEVNDEIINGPASIRVLLENQLLTGDGTGENHKGLFTQATAFSLPSGFTKLADPNDYDAAEAAILQSVKANFLPDYMLVNPSTLTNMKLTKDANGQYVVAPFVTQAGLSISAVRVVANNRIAADNFLVGDFKRAKLLIKRALTIKMFDQNENDPLYDMRTITGSLRAVFRTKTPDLAGFVKGTFTGVKADIKL